MREGAKRHDIRSKSKSYMLEILRELIVQQFLNSILFFEITENNSQKN